MLASQSVTVNTKMLFITNIVVIVIVAVSFCQTEQISTGSNYMRVRDDPDPNPPRNIQEIFDILAKQDEKLNRLHTLVLRSELLPKCALAIINSKISAATKCWKGLLNEIKVYDQSATTDIQLMGQLIADSYNGERSRIRAIVQFVKNNVERGSELAYNAYDILLDEMDANGHLFFRKPQEDNGFGIGFKRNTYRVLRDILEADGASSLIFTQKLPSVVNSILKGKEIFIRNSVTKDYLYASPTNSTEVLLGDRNRTYTGYVWKLSPVVAQWDENDLEPFFITNSLDENTVLAVDDGSLVLADAKERLRSSWAMFYIQLVQGTSGEEVVIQCSYWGIKTLALDEDGASKKLLSLESLDETPSAVWLLQPAK